MVKGGGAKKGVGKKFKKKPSSVVDRLSSMFIGSLAETKRENKQLIKKILSKEEVATPTDDLGIELGLHPSWYIRLRNAKLQKEKFDWEGHKIVFDDDGTPHEVRERPANIFEITNVESTNDNNNNNNNNNGNKETGAEDNNPTAATPKTTTTKTNKMKKKKKKRKANTNNAANTNNNNNNKKKKKTKKRLGKRERQMRQA